MGAIFLGFSKSPTAAMPLEETASAQKALLDKQADSLESKAKALADAEHQIAVLEVRLEYSSGSAPKTRK